MEELIMETETTIAYERIKKFCTICGGEGHWAQEHELIADIL